MIVHYQRALKMASSRSQKLKPSQCVKVTHEKIPTSQSTATFKEGSHRVRENNLSPGSSDPQFVCGSPKSLYHVSPQSFHFCQKSESFLPCMSRFSSQLPCHAVHNKKFDYHSCYDKPSGSSLPFQSNSHCFVNQSKEPKCNYAHEKKYHSYKRKHNSSLVLQKYEKVPFEKELRRSHHCLRTKDHPTAKKKMFPTQQDLINFEQFEHASSVSDNYVKTGRPSAACTQSLQDLESDVKDDALHSNVLQPAEEARLQDSAQKEQNKCEKLERQWISLGPEASADKCPTSTNHAKFTIVSYNILSQTLLRKNSYLYDDCNPQILPWNYRWSNLSKELENLDADVLCLQEVEKRDYETDIAPWLTCQGYGMSFKKRTGNDPNKPDGVLTAYKLSKFDVIGSLPIEYHRPQHNLTSAHNVGLALLLKVTGHPSRASVCIGNTHLLYNPKRGDIKLVQLATLFAELNDLLSKHEATHGSRPPLILCGDFNSTPDSPLIHFVRSGSLFYQGLEMKQMSGQGSKAGMYRTLPPAFLPPSLAINSNCVFDEDRTSPPDERHAVFHQLAPLRSSSDDHRTADEATTTQNRGITVDFIFYSPPPQNCAESGEKNASAKSDSSGKPASAVQPSCAGGGGVELIGRLSSCTAQDIRDVNSIPNSEHSSDHLPVVAQFQLRA